MRRCVLSLLLLASSLTTACGDRCKEGAVDAFNMCVPDGANYQRADAIASGLLGIALAVDDNTTGPCPEGGTVSITGSGTCLSGTCQGDHTYDFSDCRIVHNEIEGLSIRFASGSLRDEDTSVVGSGSTVFTHHISGQVAFAVTIDVKAERREEPEEDCAVDFTRVAELFGDANITGSLCGEDLMRPLYE